MEGVSAWSSKADLRLPLSVAHEASSKPAGGTSFGKLNFNVSYTCVQEYIIEREGECRTCIYSCSTTLRRVE